MTDKALLGVSTDAARPLDGALDPQEKPKKDASATLGGWSDGDFLCAHKEQVHRLVTSPHGLFLAVNRYQVVRNESMSLLSPSKLPFSGKSVLMLTGKDV